MNNTAPTPEKWLTCNGQQLKKMARAGLYWLEKHHQHVNALNVFPVPDGDTGTNMLLTMRSLWRRVENSSEEHAGQVAQELSQGAVMGARGNSGVILSQIWRGMAHALKDKEAFTAADLGQAFKNASDTAYKGVMKPVEGTILTVMREGAEEALDASAKSTDLRFVLRRALTRAQQALERTPEQLPILKQAGVIDSGGQGLVYILEGMLQYVNGEVDLSTVTAEQDFDSAIASLPAQAHAVPEDGHLENHYDVQFLIIGEGLNVLQVRETIDAMGDSTVVVGDETLIKVHVHVDNPGEPISYGVSLGEIHDVVVENMQLQMEEIVGGSGTAVPAPAPQKPVVEPGQIAVVAVAPGEGLARVLKGMGVAAIVEGGQTNNPSTEEFLEAIGELPTDKVIILPNNKNIILAAEAARDMSVKNVVVLPTKTVPQGISALLGLRFDGDLEDVTANMRDLIAEVVSGQITIATRSVELDGVQVEDGNIIGMLDGKLCSAGSEIPTVLLDMLAKIDDIEEKEIVTLFYGEDVTEADAQEIAELIEEHYEELEVEIQPGGQPHYFYIFGIE